MQFFFSLSQRCEQVRGYKYKYEEEEEKKFQFVIITVHFFRISCMCRFLQEQQFYIFN